LATFEKVANFFWNKNLREIFVTDVIPARLVIGIMMFFATWVNYMMRVNMSVNIIAMVNDDSNATS
jgi:hypothetical protein